ncbi:MAG: hypothetical protein K2W85_09215 [Phycisphaerales bacterium]|nr:hypothetical protein [Phycisphaerales bacterium]
MPETCELEVGDSQSAPALEQVHARTESPKPAARLTSARNRWLTLAGVAGVGMIAAAGALLMSRQTPIWWRAIDVRDPVIIATAARVENGATTQLTMIRAADQETRASPPWTIALKATDASAWLATRLRPWLESQPGTLTSWPKGLEQVQVEFEGGAIIVGARVRDARGERLVSASVRPQLRDDGALWMPAAWVTLGRLNLPPSWVLPSGDAMAKKSASDRDKFAGLPEVRELWAALGGDRPAMNQAIVKIGDGRRVKILDLRAEGGVLYVTCQTLPRESTRAGK